MSLELDKMDLPGALPVRSASSTGYRVGQRTDGSDDSRRHWAVLRILLLTIGVTLPIALMFLLWNRGYIDLPLLQSKKVLRQLEKVATVGPVMTSIGENEHLKLTVQIECRNSKLKKRLTEIGPAVKSRILMVLNSPETIELLTRRDYEPLKECFKTEIQGLLPKDSIKEIYLSEMIRY